MGRSRKNDSEGENTIFRKVKLLSLWNWHEPANKQPGKNKEVNKENRERCGVIFECGKGETIKTILF